MYFLGKVAGIRVCLSKLGVSAVQLAWSGTEQDCHTCCARLVRSHCHKVLNESTDIR